MTGRGWRRVAWAAAAVGLQKLANGIVKVGNGLVAMAASCHRRAMG